jgi:hypothetical protein
MTYPEIDTATTVSLNLFGIFSAYGIGGVVSLLASIIKGKDLMGLCVWLAIAWNISTYVPPLIYVLFPIMIALWHGYWWIRNEYYEPTKMINEFLNGIFNQE